MTLEEVAIKLGKSPATIKTSLKRTQENLKKKGIILIKIDKNNYEIEYMTPEEMKERKGE